MGIKTDSVVLITGASGFIGRHAQAHLLNMGFTVRILLRSEPTHRIDCHPKLQKYYGDVMDVESLEEACEGVGCIVHLAGIAHVNHRENCIHKINVNGTKLLLDVAIAKNVEKFIFISSSLAAEAMHDLDAPAAYGAAKLLSERLVMHEHTKGNIVGVVLRPVNVYGIGMRGNIALLIRLISKGFVPELPAFDSKLSMVGVNDLSRVISLSIKSERANGRTYLITDGQQYSISAIEREIYKVMGKKMSGLKLPHMILYLLFMLADLLGRVLRICNCNLPALGNLNLRTYRRLVSDNLFNNNEICDELLFKPESSFYSELPKIIKKIND